MSSQFYLDRLYPLQDVVLEAVSKTDTRFYLTGGTAVSRFFFHHRFSDDLDFFLNNDKEFVSESEKLLETLDIVLKGNVKVSLKQDRFVRLFVTSEKTVLKIEMINDVGFRFGKPSSVNGIRIDNIQNILSNKLCALARNAPKDIADILLIVQHHALNWIDTFDQAKNKDTWVNEIDIATHIDGYDVEQLRTVLWTKEPDYPHLQKCLHTIAKDILLGADNSLFSVNSNQ